MSKKIFTSVVLSTALVSAAWGQRPGKYIQWEPQGGGFQFTSAYRNWSPGQMLYPDLAEDENFFVARVRPKQRFTNPNTQVNPDKSPQNDKNLIAWLPIGQVNGGKDNALPSGLFDSDVFSLWSYVTHWGNWTAPMVRIPGAFVDVAHKNGVSVSAVGSIPWAATITPRDGGWGQLLSTLYSSDAQKFVKFLKQYGYDGWGLNSEFNGRTVTPSLLNWMEQVYDYAVTQGNLPTYAMAWYTLVTDQGSYSAAYNGLGESNLGWYINTSNRKKRSNYVFGNYNWSTYQLSQNDRLAAQYGGDPRDVYAGMNIQGSEGKRWLDLENSKTGIGLWGAHNMNIFFESRNEMGSAPKQMQNTYQTRLERFFTNGAQNPAKKLAVRNTLDVSARANANFHGVSAFSTAKSTLSWDLDQEAFFTYFSLGNGRFFNNEGKTTFASDWYNLGMQDYLPTWRWWLTTAFLASEYKTGGATIPENLKASISWDDAWFGGSSLRIKGSQANTAYLHLFKTKFALKEGDKITIRYKVNSGSADLDLVSAAEGTETTEVSAPVFRSGVELDEWIEKTITVGSGRTALRLAGQTAAIFALKLTNASNLDLTIGEFSIRRGVATTPNTPNVNSTLTKALARTFRGVDMKINFSMDTPAEHQEGTPVYNDEVKTAFFKVYARKDANDTPRLVGASTSWATMIFSIPLEESANSLQIGVSAVGLDGVTESEIGWSSDITTPASEQIDDIAINLNTVKANQTFEVGYVDPTHAPSTWTLINNKTGQEVGTFTNVQSFSTALEAEGLYDVKVVANDVQVAYLPGLVQVTSEQVGAVPEIKTLTFNGEAADQDHRTQMARVNEIAYTGRPANGSISRGLDLKEGPMNIVPQTIGLTERQPWTLAFWVKFNSFNGTTQFFNVRRPKDDWPENNWGFIWSMYDPQSKTLEVFNKATGEQHHGFQWSVDIPTGIWMHITFVYDWKTGEGGIPVLYINGKKVEGMKWKDQNAGMNNWADNPRRFTDPYTIVEGTYLMFGGNAAGRAGVDGTVDEVKYFERVLTDEEVKTQMYAQDKTVSGMKGYWDFETNADENFTFKSTAVENTQGELKWGNLEATGVLEGQTDFQAKAPTYGAGSPFFTGTIYTINTTPTFTFRKGTLSETTGNDQAGSAKVSYPRTGVFQGTLKLENSWGSAIKTIEVINVVDPNGVEMTDAVSLSAFPNPFVEEVNIRFPEAGSYLVEIFDTTGTLVQRKALEAVGGSVFSINVEAGSGIYLLRVRNSSGKLLQTLKLQKR